MGELLYFPIRPHRRRGRRVAAFTVGSTLLLGVAACSVTGDSQKARQDVGGASEFSDPNQAPPVATTAPAASADTSAARELAIRYVGATKELMAHSPIKRREILAEFVRPDDLEAQTRAADATIDDIETRIGRPTVELVWVETPLSAAVEPAPGTATTVTVDVWTVSVFAHPEAPTVEQLWRTVHVTVDLVAGQWRVTHVSSSEGPTPTANELALASPVEDFVEVASWTPAAGGGS